MHERELMPERVAAFLGLHRDDIDEIQVISYDPMAGGYSRSMASARIRYRAGEVTLEETVVLRGDPPPGHAMIETDRDHEWMVLEALTALGAIPIPPARHYDSTGEHLGTKAIVMDHVAGGSLQSLLDDVDDYGDHPTRLAQLWGGVHAVTPDQLPDAMPHPLSWDDHIDGLIEMWHIVETRSVNSDPVARYIAAWLAANKPPPLPLRLTHGDPQAPNVMLDPDGEYLLVDWEFASIGDPREDLGWYNIYSSAAGPNLYTHDPEPFLAAYREATGFGETEVNQWTVGYFTILAGIKIGATINEQLDRFAMGENSGVMTALQVGSLCYGHEQNLAAIAGLQAALDAEGAST